MCVFSLVCLVTGVARAETVNGSWKFTSSGEYFGDANLIVPLAEHIIKVFNGNLILSPSCTVKLHPESYAYSIVFQGLLREKVRADQLNKYLDDNFALDLRDVQTAYRIERSPCTNGLQEAFVVGDRMLVVASNTIFYAFIRDVAIAKQLALGGQKISPLPFSPDKFEMRCAPVIPKIKGVPQMTGKCGPEFYPYVARKGDQDSIGMLVGHHRYRKGNPKYHNDYDDPVSNNFHPIYMVLPPMKDVALVRVEDQDGNAEDRDVFGGAYLSIKGGVVIDQLDDGCTFMPDYSCVDDRGAKVFVLAENGKFVKY